MRAVLFVAAVGLIAALLASPRAACQEKSEWVDLLDRDLKDWTRMGVGKNPWRVTADRTLICSPAEDAYTPDMNFRDGTVKFEYRFRPTDKKTGYKAFVSARWTQAFAGARVSLGDDCGTIVGTFVASSDSSKELLIVPKEKLGRAPGEWNLVKLQMSGRSVAVWINGKEAGSFGRCPKDHGLVIFETDGSGIEFRHIQWKERK